MVEANKNIQTPEAGDKHSGLPYTHCLNCGEELQGKYCHACGQEAVDKTPTVASFIKEYIGDAYNWDSNFVHTLWTLISRPGHLTNEFLAGKITSQVHPLKLNMFLLFIFITLFVFFASADKMTDSVERLSYDERVMSAVLCRALSEDPEYVKKMEESPRDTILLQAPLSLSEKYSHMASPVEIKEQSEDESLDRWLAVVPQVLVEDEVVVIDESGHYRFNPEIEVVKNELFLVNSVGAKIIGITSQYFPILLLLTAPFLSFSLRLVQRKSKIPRVNHFVFALHYTAFLEFLIICIYVLYLAADPSMRVLEYILLIGSCSYLAIAFRRVYDVGHWWRAIFKSLLTSWIYFVILQIIFVVIFIVACVMIAIEIA